MTPTPYDALRYPGKFYPQASPSQFAVVATLFGLNAPRLEGCRVLELGCGEGGQLVPIAAALPGSECLGVDLSSAAIGRARAFAERSGVSNCAFRAQDLSAFPADAGEFDFIIAHGVYSWVPEPVRQAILGICARHLSEEGLAYISYNAYPGGHVRQILRDLTVFQTKDIEDPAAKVREARHVAELIVSAMPAQTLERQLFERVLLAYRESDALVRFDLLSEENDPLYFLDFMESALGQGLQFVAESSFATRPQHALAEPVRAWLAAMPERLVREQYLDFIDCSGFRQNILCRAGRTVAAEATPGTLAKLFLRSSLAPLQPLVTLDDTTEVKFRNAVGRELSCTDAVPKAAYAELGRAFPQALAYGELRSRINRRLGARKALDAALESKLMHTLFASQANGVVELYLEPPRFPAAAGAKPRASAVARAQAEQGMPVAVLAASAVMAIDRPVRVLLALLDGTRNRTQLLTEWRSLLGPEPPVDAAALERALRVLAAQGLLIADHR